MTLIHVNIVAIVIILVFFTFNPFNIARPVWFGFWLVVSLLFVFNAVVFFNEGHLLAGLFNCLTTGLALVATWKFRPRKGRADD
jgi:hypothetical protein